MKKKTPLQQILKALQDADTYDHDPIVRHIFERLELLIEKCIPIEKQTIIDAYNCGFMAKRNASVLEGDEYYKQNFGDEKTLQR